MVLELARFATKGTHTIPAWSGLNRHYQVPSLHTCTSYRPLHHIYDLAEVCGCSREAGAASHSRYWRLGNIPKGTADTVEQARVPSRESDNATWCMLMPLLVRCFKANS